MPVDGKCSEASGAEKAAEPEHDSKQQDTCAHSGDVSVPVDGKCSEASGAQKATEPEHDSKHQDTITQSANMNLNEDGTVHEPIGHEWYLVNPAGGAVQEENTQSHDEDEVVDKSQYIKCNFTTSSEEGDKEMNTDSTVTVDLTDSNGNEEEDADKEETHVGELAVNGKENEKSGPQEAVVQQQHTNQPESSTKTDDYKQVGQEEHKAAVQQEDTVQPGTSTKNDNDKQLEKPAEEADGDQGNRRDGGDTVGNSSKKKSRTKRKRRVGSILSQREPVDYRKTCESLQPPAAEVVVDKEGKKRISES